MRTKMLMKFKKDLTNQPITYELIKQFDLCINILKADINFKLEGYLIMDIEGPSKNIADALDYLEKAGVEADLITNTIEIDRTRCVTCGICTGTCEVRALSLHKETRNLEYTAYRCVGCNQCVLACPTRAIKNTVG